MIIHNDQARKSILAGGACPACTQPSAGASDEFKPKTKRSLLRLLGVAPGVVASLLPSFACPACLAAYFGVASALGLGFLFTEEVLVPLIVVFLVVGVLSVARTSRSHGRYGPLVATVVGAAAISVGRLVFDVPVAVYLGAAFMIGAAFWNLWLKRPHGAKIGSPSASTSTS